MIATSSEPPAFVVARTEITPDSTKYT